MAEGEGDALGGACEPRERQHDAGPRAPGDMKARHGIAVPDRVVAAALRPADDGKEFEPALDEPGSFLARREVDVGLRPFARPMILRAIESRCPHPVGEREGVTVTDAEPALLRRIDEEQAAERPERLTAERGLRLLVEDERPLARRRDFDSGDEPRKSAADDDDVGLQRQFRLP